MTLDRKAAGLSAIASRTAPVLRPRNGVNHRKPYSLVATLSCDRYSDKLEELLFDALKLFPLDVHGRAVLLKPNLVDDLPSPVNTDSILVGAAARSFLRLGAAKVVVGEGPGHQRDTELVLQATGLDLILKHSGIGFVDLNRDELERVRLKANYSGLGELWLPRTVLTSALIVSMPKVKTHHWSGVTLSMKNMFGIVPGMKYGWPKNLLHWHGIPESILDICATVPIHFVIADGIVAMEGNGPLQGTSRLLNKLVLSNDPVSADATCARLMGLEPRAIRHIRMASAFLGNLSESDIVQVAEAVGEATPPFDVLPNFSSILRSR